MSGTATGAKLHNEMVERWLELSFDLPPEEMEERIVDEFKEDYPSASAKTIYAVAVDARQRMTAELTEHDAITSVFRNIIAVAGDIDDDAKVFKILEARAANGDKSAIDVLAELQAIAPMLGPEYGEFIRAAKL